MKVYFAASLSGKNRYEENYRRIIESIKELGYRLVDEHVLETDYSEVKNAMDKDLVKYYQKTLKNISDCDVVVAEVSYPTIGIGHEISVSLDKGKPVIVLVEEGSLFPQILKAVPSANVKTYKYSQNNVKQILSSALENSKDLLPVRFNFFISPQMNAYLDWVSRMKRISRAVYLREILERDMAKNKEFRPASPNP